MAYYDVVYRKPAVSNQTLISTKCWKHHHLPRSENFFSVHRPNYRSLWPPSPTLHTEPPISLSKPFSNPSYYPQPPSKTSLSPALSCALPPSTIPAFYHGSPATSPLSQPRPSPSSPALISPNSGTEIVMSLFLRRRGWYWN